MKKEQDYDDFKDAFLYALEQNKEVAKKVFNWLKSDEFKEKIEELEKEAQANESN